MKKRKEKAETTARRWPKFWRRYINGTRGVISLFLAILMVPFVTIAGALINAARINSAVAIFDEALCNASNSTLGTYDTFLRERFGLLAMSQNTAFEGRTYTVQELISDTFQKYMEENLKVLSNTYTSSEVSAAGIYPLADTNVLLSEVLEYSKYTIPTELVIDGLSLDDILKKLTNNLGLVTSGLNTITAGINMDDKITSCKDSLDALQTKLGNSGAARTEYEAAYANFKNAVNEYNELIDEMEQTIQKEQSAVNDAEDKVSECEKLLRTEASKLPELVAQIEALENETDAQGNPVDNSEVIAQLEKEHESELTGYLNARRALDDANEELSKAQAELQSKTASCSGSLSEKRSAVETARAEYETKIGVYTSAVLDAGNAVTSAQNSVSAAIQSSVSLASNVVSTVYEKRKQSADQEIADMKESKKAASERGDDTAAYLWQDNIDEAEEIKNSIGNEQKITTGVITEESKAMSALNEFASDTSYRSAYSTLYSGLVDLKEEVRQYTVPTEDVQVDNAESFYVSGSEPLTASYVQEMVDNLEEEIRDSGFLALLEAIANFIIAMFDISFTYDSKLNAIIDNSNYSATGGLPSTKDRSSGSSYCLDSEFADADSVKSDYYKELLGAYSSNGLNSGSVSIFVSVLTAVMYDIRTISDCVKDFHWYRLGEIFDAACDVINQFWLLAQNMLQVIGEAIWQKLLLAGYIAYNTANRTTYEGAALTGASFCLPRTTDSLVETWQEISTSNVQSLAFYGAETEYIIHGSFSEQENQENLFQITYLIRFVYDIAFVILNQEVATVAEAAGAPTFGIGTLVVYVLYLLAEPLADTLVLVNGGSVPIWKNPLYLTPSGIVNLVGEFWNLGLSANQKNKAYQTVVQVMGAGFPDEKFPQNYADAVSAFGTAESGLSSYFKIDYTQTLLLIMMFVNSEDMLDRLCDIIQMESTYKALEDQIDTYTFDLDNSYTYLRASGSFTTNEFIRLSDSSGLTSKERVVYRGY